MPDALMNDESHELIRTSKEIIADSKELIIHSRKVRKESVEHD